MHQLARNVEAARRVTRTSTVRKSPGPPRTFSRTNIQDLDAANSVRSSTVTMPPGGASLRYSRARMFKPDDISGRAAILLLIRGGREDLPSSSMVKKKNCGEVAEKGIRNDEELARYRRSNRLRNKTL